MTALIGVAITVTVGALIYHLFERLPPSERRQGLGVLALMVFLIVLGMRYGVL